MLRNVIGLVVFLIKTPHNFIYIYYTHINANTTKQFVAAYTWTQIMLSIN